jgi:hypothetical protein
MYSNILSTGDIHDTLFELCEIHARMHVFMCMYGCQCVYMCTPVFLREVCRACMSGNKCENEGGGGGGRGGGPCKRNMSESIKVRRRRGEGGGEIFYFYPPQNTSSAVEEEEENIQLSSLIILNRKRGIFISMLTFPCMTRERKDVLSMICTI